MVRDLNEAKAPFEGHGYWKKDGMFLDPDRDVHRQEAGLDQETIDKLDELENDDPLGAYELARSLGSEEEAPIPLDAFDPETNIPLPDGFYDPQWDDDYEL